MSRALSQTSGIYGCNERYYAKRLSCEDEQRPVMQQGLSRPLFLSCVPMIRLFVRMRRPNVRIVRAFVDFTSEASEMKVIQLRLHTSRPAFELCTTLGADER